MTAECCAGWRLYVRDGCHLCEQFLLELSIDVGPGIEQLTVIDVDRDADLATLYGLRVPVLEAGGAVLCEGVYDAPRVRRALQV